MNINLVKKRLSHSITEKEYFLVDYQVIQTSWTRNFEDPRIENLLKNTSIQEFMQKKVNSTENLDKINFLKNVSKTTFIKNFKSIKKEKPIKSLERLKKTNEVLGSAKLFSFNNKVEISEFLNKSKKNKLTTGFWFVQLKQFFFKMPKDNIDSWVVKETEIYQKINVTNITNLNLFSINSKLKKKV